MRLMLPIRVTSWVVVTLVVAWHMAYGLVLALVFLAIGGLPDRRASEA